ncbi:MAG: hypothetical protein ACREBI_07420 [Nitrosotalea sp.]
MSNDDLERVTLLEVVMSRGIQALSRVELERLHTLLEQKDYGNDTKAQKSKKKLLKKISIAIYDKDEKYGSSFKMS